jgi:cholesterol transport system auxiliary component
VIGRRDALALGGASLALGAFAGCALVTPAPAEPVKEVLDRLPDQVPRARRRAGVLVVVVAQGAPLYDTTGIAYRAGPQEIAYFARHAWADRPSRMLQPLVVKTLQSCHAFTTVLSPPYFGHAPATLRVQLDELLADFPASTARLSLTAVLRDDAGRVASRTIAAQVPVADRTPEAAVRGANAAMAQGLALLAEFVLRPG